jgi:hypothetical protein
MAGGCGMSWILKNAALLLFGLSVLLALFALGSAIFALMSINDQQHEYFTGMMKVGLFFEMLARQIGWAGLMLGCAAIVHRLDAKRREGE